MNKLNIKKNVVPTSPLITSAKKGISENCEFLKKVKGRIFIQNKSNIR